jgi:hypothetical protein
MNRINSIVSRRSKCNLFADFLIGKLGLEINSIIHVTDNNNFFVINGITESSDLLGIYDLKDEFNKKYEDILASPITHTFDLIQYGMELKPKIKHKSVYHITSDNVSYHHNLIDNFKISGDCFFNNGVTSYLDTESDFSPVCSEFPHGYSYDQGRILYYYGKLISYNLSFKVLGSKLELNLLKDFNEDGEFIESVYLDDNYSDDKLKSYLLDTFDFNYNKIREEIKKVDLSLEITNPLDDYEFLKTKVKADPYI